MCGSCKSRFYRGRPGFCASDPAVEGEFCPMFFQSFRELASSSRTKAPGDGLQLAVAPAPAYRAWTPRPLGQEARSHLLAIAPPQLDVFLIGQLPAAHDDLAVKLGVGRIGHVLFLHRGVDHHFLLCAPGSHAALPRSKGSTPRQSRQCGCESAPDRSDRTASSH